MRTNCISLIKVCAMKRSRSPSSDSPEAKRPVPAAPWQNTYHMLYHIRIIQSAASFLLRLPGRIVKNMFGNLLHF